MMRGETMMRGHVICGLWLNADSNALCQGCSNEVENVIFESVLPRLAEDVLPETSAGLLLAVADRLHSLVGLFAVGCHPSALTDQFGLRRAAYGLVKMLVKSSVDLDLKGALQLAADVQPVPVSTCAE